MRFSVDLSLFDRTLHSPSLSALQRSLPSVTPSLRDYCIPVNPYFPTPRMLASMHERFETALRYYPASQAELADVFGPALGLDPASVVFGNGSTELIAWFHTLLVRGLLAIPVPTFGYWIDYPRQHGHNVAAFALLAEDKYALDVKHFVRFVRHEDARAAVICNPNNPTGTIVPTSELCWLLDELADLNVIVVDESFIDFAYVEGIPSMAAAVKDRSNLIVLKSLGKNCGLHGVRAGYAVAPPEIAELLHRALPAWNLNGVAEMLIRDFAENQDEYEECRRRAVRDREAFEARLRAIDGLTVFPSLANFVYVHLPEGVDGRRVREALLTEFGYLVRSCGNKLGSDDQHLRLAVRPLDEAEDLAVALEWALARLADRMPSSPLKNPLTHLVV